MIRLRKFSSALVLMLLLTTVTNGFTMNNSIFVNMAEEEARHTFEHLSYARVECHNDKNHEKLCYKYKTISPFSAMKESWIDSYYEIRIKDGIIVRIDWYQANEEPIELDIKELYLK